MFCAACRQTHSFMHLPPKLPQILQEDMLKANNFIMRATTAAKANEIQKAINLYTEAIRLNKSEVVSYTNRALCYLKQNKWTKCINDCTTAIALDDRAVKAYYRRMLAQEKMPNGDLGAALADCKAILRIEPEAKIAQRSLSRLESVLNANFATAYHLNIHGNNCFKAGDYEKAEVLYLEAIQLDKSEALYYTN